MKESKIDIQDLIPQPSSFKLKMFEGFKFKLKPCTGGMLIDIANTLGNIQDLLSLPNAENVSKIAMALMEYESAVKFKKQSVKTIDVMTGDESEIDIGGYSLLMHSIQGLSEHLDVYGAILMSLGHTKQNANKVLKEMKDTINGTVNSEINKGLKKKTVKKTRVKKR